MTTRSRIPRATMIAIVSAAFTLTMLASVSAYAFVRTSASVSNAFSIVDCSLEIVEDFRIPDDIAPGSTIVKDVRFENTGAGESFVRALVQFDDESVGQWARIDYNDEEWELADDGYRYCRQALGEGQLTPPVCTSVTIDSNADVSALRSFDVLAFGEAVPAKSPTGETYESCQAAFQAQAERSSR